MNKEQEMREEARAAIIEELKQAVREMYDATQIIRQENHFVNFASELEEVLFEMMDGIKAWDDNWNNQADEETNAAILEEVTL